VSTVDAKVEKIFLYVKVVVAHHIWFELVLQTKVIDLPGGEHKLCRIRLAEVPKACQPTRIFLRLIIAQAHDGAVKASLGEVAVNARGDFCYDGFEPLLHFLCVLIEQGLSAVIAVLQVGQSGDMAGLGSFLDKPDEGVYFICH
jgi:hypothetical protein